MSDFYRKHAEDYRFGWEAELMVTDESGTPLFGDTLPFDKLQGILNSVPVDEIGYLKEKYAGSGLRPYYVEGYDAGYDGNTVKGVIVKGIEIRTPIAFSIGDSVALFENYYEKMQKTVAAHGMRLSCFGTHPFQPAFEGDRGRRDVIGWASAETAMTTHGLVINISLPDSMEAQLDREKLNCRLSYAAPVKILFAGNTPFKNGKLWSPEGQQAFSERSYRRSFVRNTVYYRDDQHHRKEFTLFDMTNDLSFYSAYAALCLGLTLSDAEVPIIPDRFSKENVRRVALHGYDAKLIDRHHDNFTPAEAAARVLDMCDKSLTRHGFDAGMLKPLHRLLAEKKTPAHGTIEAYKRLGSIEAVLQERSQLISSHGQAEKKRSAAV